MAFTALAKLKRNSVPTTIAAPGISAAATTIPVTELSRFYDVDGTLITRGIMIGGDNANSILPEEITITGASGTSGAGNLTGATRGLTPDGTIGAACAWPAGTNIAVTLTISLWNIIKDNFGSYRERLTANRTYYVRTDGNDSNTGLVNDASGAFLTIQKAYDVVVANLDTSGYAVTIQVGDGTYAAGLSATKPWLGGGLVTIRGNLTAPYTGAVISTGASNAFSVSCLLPTKLTIEGFNIISNIGIFHQGVGTVFLNKINYGATTYHNAWAANTGAIISLYYSSIIISGNCSWSLNASNGGYINAGGVNVTLTGTPAFAGSYIRAMIAGSIDISSIVIASGTATGSYFTATMNGVINYGGATLPGNSAGTTATGGQAA
jgi:hypothetical protein